MKTEMHLHAKDLLEEYSAQEILDRYEEAGYGAIVVTDVFRRRDFEKKGQTLEKFFAPFQALLKAAAGRQIAVLPGAELDHGGHFLIYGLLPTHFQKLIELKTFSTILEHVHQSGGIIIQAHPFRVKKDLFWHQLNLNADGFEILNGAGYNDNNETVQQVSDILQKMKVIGSDVHMPDDCAITSMEINLASYSDLVASIAATKTMTSEEVLKMMD